VALIRKSLALSVFVSNFIIIYVWRHLTALCMCPTHSTTTSVCPLLCSYLYVFMHLWLSLWVPHFCPLLPSSLYVPPSELLNQFVEFCLSWYESYEWLRHVPPALSFGIEWIDGVLSPRACLGIVMKTKMSTPARNRTPDWRTAESPIDTWYARGCVHIQHPVNWVLAAEQLGRSWTH